jgi:hypothetical protein
MKTTIKLPDSWDEVTLRQYQEISSIDTDDTTRRWVEIIAILSNEDPERVKCMDVTAFTKAITHLHFMLTLPEDKIFKDELLIDGKTYKFKERLESLSMGEWIDLEAYIEETNHNLHKTFAVLYDGHETLEKRAELFKDNVMIGDVYAALVFFSLIGKESMITIKDFLTLETEAQKTLEEETKRMAKQN